MDDRINRWFLENGERLNEIEVTAMEQAHVVESEKQLESIKNAILCFVPKEDRPCIDGLLDKLDRLYTERFIEIQVATIKEFCIDPQNRK